MPSTNTSLTHVWFSQLHMRFLLLELQEYNFFCLLVNLKTDLVNEYTGIKEHLVLIKTKTFWFKKTFDIKYFHFSPWIFKKNNWQRCEFTKYFSTAVHIFFTCKMMPGKACTNHRLRSYNLFSNCRQNVRIQLCTSITSTSYRMLHLLVCALFFPTDF